MTYSIDELRSMQLSGNFRGLIFALSAPDSLVRAEAMSRLTKFKDESVREAAIKSLSSDPSYSVRTQACVVLRNLTPSKATTDALCVALNDENRHVRSNAALSLAQLRARDSLKSILDMCNQGVEPDIEDTVNMAIDILSTPNKSDTLLNLAEERDIEGIGKLFDCMLRPDHEEIENGLANRGKNRMLDVFKEWESEGRLTALEGTDIYARAKEEYATRLIDALD
jgi:HEAT repeat protein